MSVLAVLTTVADAGTAQRLARSLVEEKLAACVNILPNVTSIYQWQGAVEEAGEILCICKTTAEAWPQLQARLKELHPYEVPEMIALPVHDGWPEYLKWVEENVAPGA